MRLCPDVIKAMRAAALWAGALRRAAVMGVLDEVLVLQAALGNK